VVVGVAVTVVPVDADKPVEGDHVYVLPPLAVSVATLPAHIVWFAPPSMVGSAFTVTPTVPAFWQPCISVPVTVYVVVAVGVAVTEVPVLADNVAAGAHV